MSIVCPTCPLDFHHFPGVILVPLSPLHKGTIVSALSPSLFEVLRVTCLHVVLGTHQRRSLTLFCLCPGIRSRSHPLQQSHSPTPQTHYNTPTPRLTIASTSTPTIPTTQPTITALTQPTITMSASATGVGARSRGGGGGGAPATAAAALPTPSNGGMRGIPPAIFDGTRTLADEFWAQFRWYKMVNRTHDSMTRHTIGYSPPSPIFGDPWSTTG